MKIFKSFWFLLNKKQKIFFFVIIFFSIIQALLEMIGIAAAIPFITFLLNPEKLNNINLFDRYLKFENFKFSENKIILLCFVFFSIFLVKNIFILISNFLNFKFLFTFRTKLYSIILNKLVQQDFKFFLNKNMSKIFNVAFNEVNMFIVNLVRPIIFIISEIVISFAILLLIIITGNYKGLILIIPIIFFVSLILRHFNKSLKSWSTLRVKSNEKFINSNFKLFQGIKEIILYGRVDQIISQTIYPLNNLKKIDIKNNLLGTVPKVLLEQSVILILILIIILLNLKGIQNDDILIALGFYLAAAYRLVPSINKIFTSIHQIKFGKISAPKIQEFHNLVSKNIFLTNNQSLNFKNKIELKNISFKYKKNDINIISNLNLNLKKKSVIGIFGDSGSGKTTFINLLTSLLKPTKGAILVDKYRINTKEDYRHYKNLFSIVSQDSYLIEGSIKQNIVFGSLHPFDKKKFEYAIRFSGLNKILKNFSNGLRFNIGGNIKKISSGQKQRILISRAIYNNRDFLIFDEATNALDKTSERIIINNIIKLKKTKNIIIVSHDINNLKNCDKLYKFNNKKITKIK